MNMNTVQNLNTVWSIFLVQSNLRQFLNPIFTLSCLVQFWVELKAWKLNLARHILKAYISVLIGEIVKSNCFFRQLKFVFDNFTCIF